VHFFSVYFTVSLKGSDSSDEEIELDESGGADDQAAIFDEVEPEPATDGPPFTR